MSNLHTVGVDTDRGSSETTPDTVSFDALYRAHAADLRAFCTRRLGSPDDGHDAAHETLLRAATSTWRGEASLRWWLGRIARNVCIDVARRRNRELPLTDEPLHTDPAPATRAGPLEQPDPTSVEETVERRARIDLVHASLTELPARDRRVVELFHLRGLSYTDIAHLEGTTSAAVRTRLHRARRQLRDTIQRIAPRDRLWPLPALLPALGRLRSRLNQPRARFHDALTEHAAGASASLGSLVGHTTTHFAAAVIGTVGLTVGGTAPPPPAPDVPGELTVPILSVHPPADTANTLGALLAAAAERSTRVEANPTADSQATATTLSDTRSSPPETGTSDGPALDTAPNPTVENNAEQVASEPVQQQDSSNEDPGFTTTAPELSVDNDGDGESDHDRAPSVRLSCGNPDQHGPVTALACDTHESLSETPADPPNSSKDLEPAN